MQDLTLTAEVIHLQNLFSERFFSLPSPVGARGEMKASGQCERLTVVYPDYIENSGLIPLYPLYRSWIFRNVNISKLSWYYFPFSPENSVTEEPPSTTQSLISHQWDRWENEKGTRYRTLGLGWQFNRESKRHAQMQSKTRNQFTVFHG